MDIKNAVIFIAKLSSAGTNEKTVSITPRYFVLVSTVYQYTLVV